ncbi:MAG: TonB family protein [candidate division KSB1 bacterium]|nr:TonB family protein [candidate division KSB1 bacterium]
MKQKHSLKLRIERNGKVTHRTLNGKEEFTVGRSPHNDIVIYGENYPKRLPIFVPTNSGYELRLAGNSRGEVVYEKSRLAFADLLQHELLQRRQGYPALPLKPGKAGCLFLDDVRIDFAFDGASSEVVRFEGFSPWRAFAKALLQDSFFKTIVAVLVLFHSGLAFWASQKEIIRSEQPIELEKVQQRFVRYIPKLPEEAPVKKEPLTAASKSAETKSEAEANKTKEERKKQEQSEKKGYGENAPGEGVNLEKVGALALIGGMGTSMQSSSLMETLISRDLAKSLNEVMASGKNLSAGRGTSGVDPNAILAAGLLGEGSGGNSSIDDILKSDVANAPSVKLEKTGKVSVDHLGKVSGSEEAVGARSEESLRKVLSQNMGRLQYIYNKYLKTHPDIGGKVEVEVTINAEGSIANVTILSSEIAIAEFQREITAAIRRWKYEPIREGQVKVVYPILFVKIS